VQHRPEHSQIFTYIFIGSHVKALDKDFQVDAINTDFQKAFDKMNHNLLYYKLKNHGIGGNFLK
jgi:hypothetical protein